MTEDQKKRWDSTVWSTSIILLLNQENECEIAVMLQNAGRIADAYKRMASQYFTADVDLRALVQQKCQLLVITKNKNIANLIRNSKTISPDLHVDIREITEQTLTDGKNSLLAGGMHYATGDTAILFDNEISPAASTEISNLIQFECADAPTFRGHPLLMGPRDHLGRRHLCVICSTDMYLRRGSIVNLDFDKLYACERTLLGFRWVSMKKREKEPYTLNDVLVGMRHMAKQKGWRITHLSHGKLADTRISEIIRQQMSILHILHVDFVDAIALARQEGDLDKFLQEADVLAQDLAGPPASGTAEAIRSVSSDLERTEAFVKKWKASNNLSADNIVLKLAVAICDSLRDFNKTLDGMSWRERVHVRIAAHMGRMIMRR